MQQIIAFSCYPLPTTPIQKRLTNVFSANYCTKPAISINTLLIAGFSEKRYTDSSNNDVRVQRNEKAYFCAMHAHIEPDENGPE